MKSLSHDRRSIALLRSAKARYTRPFKLLFNCRVYSIWVMDLRVVNSLVNCSAPALWSTITRISYPVITIGSFQWVRDKNKCSGLPGAKKTVSVLCGTQSYFMFSTRLRQQICSPEVKVKSTKTSLQQCRTLTYSTPWATFKYITGLFWIKPSLVRVLTASFYFADASSSAFCFDSYPFSFSIPATYSSHLEHMESWPSTKHLSPISTLWMLVYIFITTKLFR